MSDLFIVTGAGPVGTAVAEVLRDRGARVRVLTRSGSGPEGTERLRVDARDADAVAARLAGADAVFHCAHAAYSAKVWARDLPAAERVVLDAAADAGAPVVFPESLYSYTRSDLVMDEDGPRDAAGGKRGVRTALLAARAAHRAATASVVAGDFIGPGVLSAHGGERMLSAVFGGRTLQVIGRPDVPHSFTYVPDLAAAMVAVADRMRAGASEGGSDRVWHAPTAPAVTQAELAALFARAAGVGAPRVVGTPAALLTALGLVMPSMRELAETAYQFTAPFVLDSTRSQRELGLRPTPLPDAAAATVAWWRARA